MSITPGNHKIKTHSGKYLTLVTQTGVITAMPMTGASNQVWEFQLSGTRYTMQNIGYAASTYAYSTGQDGAWVTGNPLTTEWAVFPSSGVYSIQYGNNTSFAFGVGEHDQVTLVPAQLSNPTQLFNIE